MCKFHESWHYRLELKAFLAVSVQATCKSVNWVGNGWFVLHEIQEGLPSLALNVGIFHAQKHCKILRGIKPVEFTIPLL